VIITPEEILHSCNHYETEIYEDLFELAIILQKYTGTIIPYLESHYLGAYLPEEQMALSIWKGNIPDLIQRTFDLPINDYSKFTEKLINLIIDESKFKKLERLRAFW
jgi:predicted choloylglycine hydrolase